MSKKQMLGIKYYFIKGQKQDIFEKINTTSRYMEPIVIFVNPADLKLLINFVKLHM